MFTKASWMENQLKRFVYILDVTYMLFEVVAAFVDNMLPPLAIGSSRQT